MRLTCEFCNKLLSTEPGRKNHEHYCNDNPEKLVPKKAKYSKKLVICHNCNYEINAKQITNHQIRCSAENPRSPFSISESLGKSKRQPNFTSDCKFCGVGIYRKLNHHTICRKNPANRKEKIWDDEARAKHSESMKQAVRENLDSYTKNNVSGRVKLIEYNGVKLKGSWEVITAKWLDSLNIKWESEVNSQEYIWNNGTHLYFPDFYLVDYNVYIEVKGYKRDRDTAKWNSFNGILTIIDSKNIFELDQYNNITDFINKEKYSGL